MTSQKPLRLWPGVVAVVLQWLLWFGLPLVAPPDAAVYGILVGMAFGLVVLLWWLFFSRAPWAERVGAIALMVLGIVAIKRVVHPSIAGGMMGMMLFIFAVPALGLALVAGAAAGRRLSSGPRRAAIAAAIALACGALTLLRTGGISGNSVSDFHWRWTPTPEERLLAQAGNEHDAEAPAFAEASAGKPAPAEAPAFAKASAGKSAELSDKSIAAGTGAAPAAPTAVPAFAGASAGKPAEVKVEPASGAVEKRAEWSGFRGPDRDSIVRGARINTNWSASPPVEIWRRPIGPGWSSFAVHGNLIYTQEQRGDDEIVASYSLTTGAPVWKHRDPVRFYESNGGAGPRATPTLSKGRVYTFGATGIVNALDAATGRVVWSRNAASDTKIQVPEWGFSSSPLVVGDVVIVAVSGSLVGYDVATGKPRWFGPSHGGSYSSPHLFTVGGTAQVVLLSGAGATSVAPGNGQVLWEHEWPGSTIVQPALTADGDILINTMGGMGGVGTRRLAVAHGPGGWRVEERWTSNGLKPYFNDFVVHNGHAFGFDGSILACIDLSDGKRKWKGGRYGNGQLVLLPDQDLLLVLSEEGELVLVRAMPDQFTEVARFPALEGKTWNHPVLVGDVLLVRNGEEMAAFRLSVMGAIQ
jgi:outer membrane protein assembly factor BamB/multidrug transporter EmrE-like cation transporter